MAGGIVGAGVGGRGPKYTLKVIVLDAALMLLIVIPVSLIIPPLYPLVLGFVSPAEVPCVEIPVTPGLKNKSVPSPRLFPFSRL